MAEAGAALRVWGWRLGIVLGSVLGAASTLFLISLLPALSIIFYGLNLDMDAPPGGDALNWAGVAFLIALVTLGIVAPLLFVRRYWRRAFPR